MQESITLNTIASVRDIEDEFIKRLSTTLRKLETGLIQYMNESKGLEAVDVALSRAQLEQILVDSGYYEVTGQLLDGGYQEAINLAYENYVKQYAEELQFSPVSLQRLNALKDMDLAQFKQLADNALQTANRLITDVNFGAIDFNTAVSTLTASVTEPLAQYATTWITTGLSSIHRESNTMLAMDNGFTEFIYEGPLDKVTRKWCAERVHKTFTIEEINGMDNGQDLPAMQYGGGYRCRHQWVGVR